MNAWAVTLDGKIMEVDSHGKLELYTSYELADSQLEGIQELIWVKGPPKIVRVEIRFLK